MLPNHQPLTPDSDAHASTEIAERDREIEEWLARAIHAKRPEPAAELHEL